MIARIVIAVLFLVPFGALLFIQSSFYYSLVVGAVCAISLFEFYKLLQRKGFTPFVWWGVSGVVLLTLSADPSLFSLCKGFFESSFELMGFVGTVFILGILLVQLNRQVQTGVLDALLTLAGVFYIGFLGSYFIFLRNLREGSYFLFILFLFTWCYDGGAYFVGTFIGRHSLSKEISPKKTWEGFFGGFGVCALVFLILKRTIMPQLPISIIDGLMLTILLGFMGQMGDLSESMLKRFVEVKDSSPIFPEHGGFLDKIDSLLFTAPCLYYYAIFVLKMK